MSTDILTSDHTTPPFPVETRCFQTPEGEQRFEVLRITKPELWPPATTFRTVYSLKSRDKQKAIAIPLRAISYLEWYQIEFSHPMPEWQKEHPEPPNGDPEFQIQKEYVRRAREVLCLEVAMERKIPGDSLSDKIAWIEQLGAGETQSLYYHILEHNSNMTVVDGSLVESYNATVEKSNNVKVLEFNDFNDWLKLSESGTSFLMQRPSEDYIVEFPLKNISQSRSKEIAIACREPVPPAKPGKNPVTGKPDAMYPEYNYQDARYQETCQALRRRKMVMTLDDVLPFPLPGSTFEEKYTWIGQRALGDVHRLWRFIESNILDYRGRFDFFTEG